MVAVSATGPSSRLLPQESGDSRQVGAPVASGGTEPPADAQVAAAPIMRRFLLSPSLNGGVPTGYVGGWGDYYIAGSVGTPGNLRDGVPDASLSLGIGLGDPQRYLGVDVNWGIGSIKDFNANGSLGVSVGRILVNRSDLQVAVAGGLIDAYAYGTEANKPPVSAYGAITMAMPLRPDDERFPQRLQFTLGGGGSGFAAIGPNFQTTDTGFFAAAGVELLPNLGISLGHSSRSTNLNLSYIPFAGLPVFINLVAADLFNSTPFGTVGVLSVGWGDRLQRGFFNN